MSKQDLTYYDHDEQGQASHKEKLVEIEIDLPDDLYAAVEKLSKELKITKEEFIIKAMKKFLKKEGEK